MPITLSSLSIGNLLGLLALGFGLFLVCYFLDVEGRGWERTRTAARLPVHLMGLIVLESAIRKADSTYLVVVGLVGMVVFFAAMDHLFPRDKEGEWTFAPTRADLALEGPDFAGRVYQPGISPFA